VLPLWDQHVDGGTGPQDLTGQFGADFTNSVTTARVSIEEIEGGRTRMSIESEFPSVEAMEQILAMGAEEGLKEAVSQIDAILAEDRR
jgi:hypothetical protein